jgi:hypothetical protein
MIRDETIRELTPAQDFASMVGEDFSGEIAYEFTLNLQPEDLTGTPVLTTVLPGMPEDYYPHVYFIREETPEGISQALRQVFDGGEQAMKEKGLGARSFVLENRNNVVQAQKIRNMLKE